MKMVIDNVINEQVETPMAKKIKQVKKDELGKKPAPGKKVDKKNVSGGKKKK